MPSSNVIQFSTSSLANSIKKGNAILGISSVDYGPTSTTGFWNGITPPSGGYTIYVSRSALGPNIYTPSSNNELITYSSKIANIPFTSTSGALAWFATQSNSIVVNKSYPDIVTNGLILLNDASFTPSYPTTASVWYDVSGNNKNGSLINGPLFDSNRGAIVFDGINEIVTYGTGNTFFPLPSFSIELTFQSKGTVPTTGTRPGLFGFTFGIRAIFNSANDIQFAITSGSVLQNLNYSHTSNFRDDGKWYNIIFQATPTNSYIYLNGELKASRSVVWLGSTIWPTNGWNLARDNNDGFYFFTGSISNFKLYNKILSQTEINQNYYGGPIVTDGLVFAVDASNIVSYESGSTTTYSLTGSLSGSLINGVGYSNSNSGVFVFDGVDDFISVNNPQSLNPGTGSFSLDFWCNVSTNVSTSSASCLLEARGTSLYGFLAIGYRNNGRMQLFINDNVTPAQNVYQSTTTPVQRGVWIHEAMVVDRSTQQITFYYNGVQTGDKVTITDTGSIDPGSGYVYWIGGDRGGSEMNGTIAITRQYNRVLSAQEIAQNFNAQRTRFGV
jgi:hypothetical protein